MVQISTQLALFLANNPGTLAEVCSTLAESNVNIYAIATSDSIDHTVVRMVVDQPKTALRELEKRGILVIENEVLMIEGNNKAGSLATIATCLSKVDINIEYAYCATAPHASRGLLILRPSHVGKALKALNQAKGF